MGSRPNRRRMAIDSRRIKLVEPKGVKGINGMLRYVLLRERNTAIERFWAGEEVLTMMGQLDNGPPDDKRVDAFRSMVLDTIEGNFEEARGESDKDVRWKEEWDKKGTWDKKGKRTSK